MLAYRAQGLGLNETGEPAKASHTIMRGSTEPQHVIANRC